MFANKTRANKLVRLARRSKEGKYYSGVAFSYKKVSLEDMAILQCMKGEVLVRNQKIGESYVHIVEYKQYKFFSETSEPILGNFFLRPFSENYLEKLLEESL
jgi:hypothetical protein